ncbi:hypothetical protein DL96DRAFT_1609417 [Flagelloscypha sp. PMI_526]|nr:hypothetical protein DL96DRAFT_1609417 [Flagelloscypha sp. PMI_526]
MRFTMLLSCRTITFRLGSILNMLSIISSAGCRIWRGGDKIAVSVIIVFSSIELSSTSTAGAIDGGDGGGRS